MNKIRMIKQSMRCQWLGTCSLVPVIGVGFAVAALRRYRQIRAEVGDEWNPARSQLIRGVVLGWIGILITLGVIAGVALRVWLAAIAAGRL